MNEQKPGTRDFKPDYALLELNDRADWRNARANYRHLVHLWHPDRYAQRPREGVHAQQHFIAVTKAYTHLKTFHKQHGRLPFEPIKASSPDETMAIRSLIKNHDRQTADNRTGQGTNSNIRSPDTTIDGIEEGILGRQADAGKATLKSGSATRIVWILAGCSIMLATLSIFFYLDRRTHLEIIEQGREVVREAPQSDFMPSASEIRKTEAKGAFVHPTK